ncbi:MAG: polyribonucleotide nucleotidyltransferase [Chitinophagaceae bacterium]|jgi:polyribonucleotide nucleotidyltransferase|nr:polyribonucleotide nucleotidyltransferase [Chitinophagaceae bacterium]MBP6045678.1 polyribonucleotide nucleotidyltransferase [Ferruginibacter sp.]NMD28930.1 polyribonucleotide nucleotidyltransferase [Bacteroidota bacterium]MBK7346764.1 polyribonucleotide nucleotidyltransferase [Chitinophagaceae bacterium]MBK8773279.1 polyribonucleotide nucleotidyltransferase [Chitinophagaceae bacterium]
MSLLQPKNITFDIGGGRNVTIETGKLARQADGAVTVRQGNCIILATVVANKEPKEGQSFFPLSVDYQEKFASAGRIPGSFFKREARLNDYEILTSRLIDRALRPLFPEDYLCDVQVLVSLISSDDQVMPDSLACLAASAALAVSDIPIQEIISEVRIGRVDGKWIVNPTRDELVKSDLEFIIAATEKNIMMVEGEAKECQEEDLIKAIEIAHDAIKIQIKAQAELKDKTGTKSKREYTKPHRNEELENKINAFCKDKMHAIAAAASAKHERSEAFDVLKEELKTYLGEELPEEDKPLIGHYFGELQYHVVRDMILNLRRRLDGRGTDDVRPLYMETDLLPGPHGSALFTRGETQSLTTVTLGTPLDELLVESAHHSDYTKFLLHYNFPPFSTGEVKMMRGVGRREVGHGNLAMRSLKQMMPTGEYAYTVRVVSDILESNGSSSMATVCAGSLALMDAGVPVKKHVSGVAMGLIKKDDKFAVLTDILGDEDHLGDMDFKVTGTKDGICGVQMDIKVDGLSMDIMRQALQQAKQGRMHILNAMYDCVPTHRDDVKPHAPRMVKLIIDKEYIGAVIGPGGKVIQEIQKETGTTINIEEVNDTGEVSIFCKEKAGLDKAVEWIKGITATPEVGETYEGTIKSIKDFGAFVEFLPKKEGLLHISEISWKRLESMNGIFKEGEKVKVKLMDIDAKTGKFKLSRKALMPKPESQQQGPANN